MDLFEARAKRRMTQWGLKNMTGIHQSKISLIERGYIVPTLEEKEKIAQALGIPDGEIEWRNIKK